MAMAGNISTVSSLYEVLGLTSSATGHEIKAAYRRLARTHHPDAVPVSRREGSTCEFLKIHAAYSTLSDPYKRASHDRDLMGLRISSPVSDDRHRVKSRYSSTSSYGFVWKNWESDQCW